MILKEIQVKLPDSIKDMWHYRVTDKHEALYMKAFDAELMADLPFRELHLVINVTNVGRLGDKVTSPDNIYWGFAFLLEQVCQELLLTHNEVRVNLFGYALQAIMNLQVFEKRVIYREGTIERQDRFGNSKEVEIKQPIAVILNDKLGG